MILLINKDREYLCNPGDEIGTDLGVLRVPEEIKIGDIVETHLGRKFTAVKPRTTDMFRHLERTGAPMLPRDIGLIIGMAGIGSEDRILDAGTGTGILSICMGNIGAEVVTYEKNLEFVKVAQRNVEKAGFEKQIDVRSRDVLEDLENLSGFSVVTLDMRNAEKVVEHAREILAPGGFIIIYSPFIESAKRVVEMAREIGLSDIKTMDTVQREMQFDPRGSRPQTGGVGHSGYLTFARKLP